MSLTVILNDEEHPVSNALAELLSTEAESHILDRVNKGPVVYMVFETAKSTYDYIADKHIAVEAHFCGAFTTLERAVARCRNDRYWIGEAGLNAEVPEEPVEWEVLYDWKGVKECEKE